MPLSQAGSCLVAAMATVAWLSTPCFAAVPAATRDRLTYDSVAGQALTLDPGPPAATGATARGVVLVIGASIEATDADRGAPRATLDALRAAGLAAIEVDWRQRFEQRDLAAAFEFLRLRAAELALAPDALGLHGVGDGAQAVLDATMEGPLPCRALSLQDGSGVVIERLRELPLLLVAGRAAPPRVHAALREFAHQAELSCIPTTTLAAEGSAAAAAVARFHGDRLVGDAIAPATADEDDAERAIERARVASERGDLAATLAWLERADQLEALDPQSLLHDGALVKVRTDARFRAWLAVRAGTTPVTLCRDCEPGTRVTIRGRVVQPSGAPLADSALHLYQTDGDGLYTHGSGGDAAARLYALLRSDADGRFEITTIVPGGYPRTLIPAHIHVAIDRRGRTPQMLELLFDADPRLTDSARTRAAAWGWPIVTFREEGGRQVGDATIVAR